MFPGWLVVGAMTRPLRNGQRMFIRVPAPVITCTGDDAQSPASRGQGLEMCRPRAQA